MIRIEDAYFSIPQICRSGQCFRLEPTADTEPATQDGWEKEQGRTGGPTADTQVYELYAGERYLKIYVTDKVTELACTQEEYDRFWKSYFDIDGGYDTILASIDEDDEYLKEAAGFGKGIHILRQDTWEMIVTFILSQQNNIPRIKKMIRGLCRRYGKRCVLPDGNIYFAFPGPEALAKASEEELREMKFGYRSRYLVQTARSVAAGEVELEALKNMGYADARKELMRLSGVGGKVADCICLFALHQLDAFPVDTHIQKVLKEKYPEGFPFERYKGMAGVMQQYIFYYDLWK